MPEKLHFIIRSIEESWFDQIDLNSIGVGTERGPKSATKQIKWPTALCVRRRLLFTPLQISSAELRDGVSHYLLALDATLFLIEDNGRYAAVRRKSDESEIDLSELAALYIQAANALNMKVSPLTTV